MKLQANKKLEEKLREQGLKFVGKGEIEQLKELELMKQEGIDFTEEEEAIWNKLQSEAAMFLDESVLESPQVSFCTLNIFSFLFPSS